MSDLFSSCIIVDNTTIKSIPNKEENLKSIEKSNNGKKIEESNKENKIEESNNEKNINDLLDDVLNEKGKLAESVMSEGESHFKVEHCSFCNADLLKEKYKCLICDNVIMCAQCEDNHCIEHPSLKIKTNSSVVQNTEDIYNFYYSNLKNSNPIIGASNKKIVISTQSNSKLKIDIDTPLALSFDIINKGEKENNIFIVKNNKDYIVDIDNNMILFDEKGKCNKKMIIRINEGAKSEKIKPMFFIYNTIKKDFMSNIITIDIKQSKTEDNKKNYDDFDIIGMSEFK